MALTTYDSMRAQDPPDPQEPEFECSFCPDVQIAPNPPYRYKPFTVYGFACPQTLCDNYHPWNELEVTVSPLSGGSGGPQAGGQTQKCGSEPGGERTWTGKACGSGGTITAKYTVECKWCKSGKFSRTKTWTIINY